MTAVALKKDPSPEAAPLSEDAMWAALLARDPAAEGRFLYGVITTGVYCRPTCPSRRPLRSNVRFFSQAADAEAAGLRACKRCQPTAAPLAEPGPPVYHRPWFWVAVGGAVAVAAAVILTLALSKTEYPGADARVSQ